MTLFATGGNHPIAMGAPSCLNRTWYVLFALITTLLVSTNVFGQQPATLPNPDLDTGQACNEFRVVVVLDESGSIDDGPDGAQNEQSVRDAAVALATGLSGSGAELAVVEFASGASISTIDGISGFQPVDNGYVSSLNSYLSSNYNPSGCTNWGEAFDRVIQLNNSNVAQLVVFVTDGVPTIESDGPNDCGFFCSGFCQEALNVAVNRSNQVKSQGSHVFVLGVGGAQGNAAEIQAISGMDEDTAAGANPPNDPGFAQADYSLVPFSMLQPCLEDIVNQSCSQAVNPDLESLPCDELDVILVLDESGSIDDGPNGNTNEQAVRDATVALATELSGTGAQLAIVEFSTSAGISNIPGFAANWNAVTPSYIAALDTYMDNNYNANGWTNWEDAFQKALDLNAIRQADLIIFATDGNPTAYINNGSCTGCEESNANNCTDCQFNIALDRATPNSDALKASGAHLFGLAIGTDINLANISAVTGLDQDLAPGDQPGPDPAFPQADYTAIPFADLVQCIGDIAQQSCDPCSADVSALDFDTDPHGDAVPAGADPMNIWADYGITIYSDDQANNPAMIFDSANPTGGDTDLGSPNQDFGGPGVGAGGAGGTAGENAVPLGNVLIISEDGDASDPDDNGSGGVLTFDFDEPTTVLAVNILDIDFSEIGGEVRAYNAANNIIAQKDILALGENSVQSVLLSASNASRVEVEFVSSGSVSQLVLCENEEELASVGDFVYLDDDCDGVAGNTQVGIGGVMLNLLSPGGNLIAQTTTAADGSYAFEDIPVGAYQIQIVSGIDPTLTAIADLDGDLDGNSGVFNLSPLQVKNDVDFGYQTTEGCCELIVECPSSDGGSYQCIDDVPLPDESIINVIESCNTPVITVDVSNVGSGCPGGPLIQTHVYTIVDGDESTMCAIEYIVVDTQAPVFTFVPDNVSAGCNGQFDVVMAEATDNCSDVVVTFSDETSNFDAGDCGQFRTQTQGGWGAPANGNNPGVYRDANFDQAFPSGLTIGCDNELVLTSASAVQAFLPSGGTPSVLPMGTMVNPTVYSNTFAGQLVAAKLSVGFDANDPDFSDAEASLALVTYNSGLFDGMTIQQVIEIADDIIGGCDDTYSASEMSDALASFNQNYVDGNSNGNNFDCSNDICGYYVVRTFTATDACGNESIATQCFMSVDTDEPHIECPQGAHYECFTDIPAADINDVDASDDCGDVEVTFQGEVVDGDECQGTIIRTYRATDECGNFSECNQTITYGDTTDPVALFDAPDVTIECDEPEPVVDPVFTDNCDDDLELSAISGIIPMECGYLIQRSWTATDDCGNSTTVSQTITVLDTTDPVALFDAPDVTIECDEPEPVVDPVFTDNCDDDLELSAISGIIPMECGYQIQRSWTATDDCGNSTTVSQTITVVDTTDPVALFDAPDVTIECDEPEPVVDPVFTDNCDDDLELSAISGIIPMECGYQIQRSWTATDDCGNSTTVSQTITVVDTQAPELSAYPDDVEIDCSDDIPEPMQISAEDVCDGQVPVSFTEVFDDSECPQRYIRTWTAMDDCGNTESHTQIVTLLDTTAPIISPLPIQIFVECDEVDGLTIEVEDDCNEVEVTYEDMLLSGGCLGTLRRIWTATDACGNSAEATQYINVQDTTPPTIEGVGEDMALDCNDPIPAIPNVTAYDNCNYDVYIEFNEEIVEGNCPSNYQIIWTWTATDYCENVSVATKTLTISDTTAPTFDEVPEDMSLECDEAMPAVVDPVVSDDCSGYSVSFNETNTEGNCPQNRTITRTWTATDDCGNESSYTQTINITDTTAPEFVSVPANVTIQCDGVIPTDMPVAEDNCGIVEIAEMQEVVPTDCPSEYTLYRHFIATDECGNASEATQIVTVEDTSAPVLSEYPEDIILDCEDALPSPPSISASDNCDASVEVVFEQTFMGDQPTSGSSADCVASTPLPYEDGETCAGDSPWSLVLFDFNNVQEDFYTTLDVRWVEFPDGSATLTGSVVSSSNPDAGWNIDVAFENGVSWDVWSNQGFPTNYKDDCGISGDNYFDWTYYIMSQGATLAGWGDYEGDVLNLEHAPSSYYYGYQVGVAANNVNTSYGGGGWFTFDGVFNGQAVDGSGDFAFDHDCCPQYEVEWTYTATDCAGNSVQHTINVSFEDLGGNDDPNPGIGAGCAGDFDGNGEVGTTDLLLFLSDLGCIGDCGCDLNNDGKVDSNDMLTFLAAYGNTCQ